MVNRDLAACTDGLARIRAIGRNHTLWSILVKDLALAENRLPENVKTGLIALGMWSMNYSTRAILQHLPVDPLIDVNLNVMDGLLGQSPSSSADMPKAPFDA